jgi:hypothetical protein
VLEHPGAFNNKKGKKGYLNMRELNPLEKYQSECLERAETALTKAYEKEFINEIRIKLALAAIDRNESLEAIRKCLTS